MYATKSTIKWNKKYIQRFSVVLTTRGRKTMKNKTIGQIYGNHKAMGYHGPNAQKMDVSVGRYLNVGPKAFEQIKDMTPEEFCTEGFRLRLIGGRHFERISHILCTAGHYDRRAVAERRTGVDTMTAEATLRIVSKRGGRSTTTRRKSTGVRDESNWNLDTGGEG